MNAPAEALLSPVWYCLGGLVIIIAALVLPRVMAPKTPDKPRPHYSGDGADTGMIPYDQLTDAEHDASGAWWGGTQ
jgi:uncharacterized membrane protein